VNSLAFFAIHQSLITIHFRRPDEEKLKHNERTKPPATALPCAWTGGALHSRQA
jgi:hypothetical protein